MKNFESSAISNHFLSSILPFQTLPQHKQFTKTKQFYKPEQFIWNNPHRTSKRMYPYYHQFNDNYVKNVKPKIEKMVQNERTLQEAQRIRKLSQLRDETRRKFHSRKANRQKLQSDADPRKKQHIKTQQLQNTFKGNKSISYAFHSNSEVRKKLASPTEISYHKGLEDYDERVNKIREMFSQQITEKHDRIRSQFKSRKQINDASNNRSKNYQQLFIHSHN